MYKPRPFCDCGQPTTTRSMGEWVCERCAILEKHRSGPSASREPNGEHGPIAGLVIKLISLNHGVIWRLMDRECQAVMIAEGHAPTKALAEQEAAKHGRALNHVTIAKSIGRAYRQFARRHMLPREDWRPTF